MTISKWWLGLKKSIIGLFFFLIAVGILLEDYGGIERIPGGYIWLLIALFAYLHIGNVYKEKLPTHEKLSLTRQQKLWIWAGAFLTVLIGMASERWIDSPISTFMLILALAFSLIWLFWDRNSWFALLLAASLAFDALLPLFISDASLGSILYSAAIGAAFFAAGIIEHRTLMRQAAVIAPTSPPTTPLETT
jgi:hypothetical protein